MSVAFKKGQVLGQYDLMIAVRDTSGNLFDPAIIAFSIYDYTTGVEILIGDPNQTPASPSTGIFYANWMVPLDANLGEFVVRWNMKQVADGPTVQVVQRFQVVGEQVVTSITTQTTEQQLVRSLRILLRDNNPDRNYRFRPPNTEKFIQSQTEVFGYIWEDEELMEYILYAVYDFNSAPPVTAITVFDMPDRWRSCILAGAAARACAAVAMNWIADEYQYSVSGVSLDLDKSSKYQSMKENWEQNFDKMQEKAKNSIKIVKGLQQPRYGIGISSALGPFSRVGVQSRRNYVGGGGGYWT